MEERSKSGSLSLYDIKSWLKSTAFTLLSVFAIELLKILPIIQDYVSEYIGKEFGDQATILLFIVVVTNAGFQLLRKLLTDYTNK